MVFLFESLTKQRPEKKDYCQNRQQSLGIEPKLQNEVDDKEHVPKSRASVYKGLAYQIPKGIVACDPLDTDLSTSAKAMVKAVGRDMPFGKRPSHHLELNHAQDYGGGVNAVANRFRTKFLPPIGVEDLPAPR
jgi:hypothetical protein